ncbi:RAMP superfamily CRISPR-associated protein [Actinopolyspora sp. H202]|uniref:RAMP superfamily CRISPR-associated protein n=1 Tax=Actinopolyspora sp. H202 TaxID=1500456 RepID=UPI003EE42C6C
MKSSLITLRLRMVTAGGVTAPEALDASEETLPLRTDNKGRPQLPGSTVAGSLRAHCDTRADLAADEHQNDLFGSRPGSDARTPSPVQVLGTVCRPAGETEFRRRTAIDRERGAPATHTLHATELLPEGTEFDVVLRWDDPDHRYERFVELLRGWRPHLGRGSGVGAGLCTVVGVGEATYDLATVDGLYAWVHLTWPDDYPTPVGGDGNSSAPEPVVDVELDIVDGLHIGTGEAERESEDGPKISRVLRSGGKFVVPGSTLKGVLRSRAEYICRAVGAVACTDQSCGGCVPCRLFGFSPATGAEGTGRRGRIAVHDATIETTADPEHRQHVAIDRFTGGATDGLLYTDEVLTSGRFRLRVEPLATDLTETERLLLRAVVTDLDDGLVGIGGRSTAGLGTVRVATRSGWARPDLSPLADLLTPEAA